MIEGGKDLHSNLCIAMATLNQQNQAKRTSGQTLRKEASLVLPLHLPKGVIKHILMELSKPLFQFANYPFHQRSGHILTHVGAYITIAIRMLPPMARSC